jgi:hypothetical protein
VFLLLEDDFEATFSRYSHVPVERKGVTKKKKERGAYRYP